MHGFLISDKFIKAHNISECSNFIKSYVEKGHSSAVIVPKKGRNFESEVA